MGKKKKKKFIRSVLALYYPLACLLGKTRSLVPFHIVQTMTMSLSLAYFISFVILRHRNICGINSAYQEITSRNLVVTVN